MLHYYAPILQPKVDLSPTLTGTQIATTRPAHVRVCLGFSVYHLGERAGPLGAI
jgi:hypothetical protein